MSLKIYIGETSISLNSGVTQQNHYFKSRIDTNLFKNGILHNNKLGSDFRACVLPELLNKIGPINPLYSLSALNKTLYEDFQDH